MQYTIIAVKPSRLAKAPWLTVPYQVHAKDRTDDLVDILLCLLELMKAIETLKSGLMHEETTLTKETFVNTLRIRSRLMSWWAQFDLDQSENTILVQKLLAKAEEGEISAGRSSEQLKSINLFIELKSKWHMGMLLVNSILGILVQNGSLVRGFHNECAIHAAAVLLISDWIDQENTTGNTSHYWHIVLPLAVVSMSCPKAEAREEAERKLSLYGREKALGGVVTMSRHKRIFGV